MLLALRLAPRVSPARGQPSSWGLSPMVLALFAMVASLHLLAAALVIAAAGDGGRTIDVVHSPMDGLLGVDR